jgi:hypothetical protein
MSVRWALGSYRVSLLELCTNSVRPLVVHQYFGSGTLDAGDPDKFRFLDLPR